MNRSTVILVHRKNCNTGICWKIIICTGIQKNLYRVDTLKVHFKSDNSNVVQYTEKTLIPSIHIYIYIYIHNIILCISNVRCITSVLNYTSILQYHSKPFKWYLRNNQCTDIRTTDSNV